MNREILMKILSENEYPPHIFESVIAKIEKFSHDMQIAFELWVNEGKAPLMVKEGYSFEILCKDYGMNPVGAFLTLDWLEREPLQASLALRDGIK